MRKSVPLGRRLAFLFAALALASMSKVGWAGVLSPDNLPTMTWGIEGPLASTWNFNPTIDMFAPAPGGGYQMTSSPTFDIFDGRAQVTVAMLAFDPDPFVLNNILVTNTTTTTQIFSAFIGVPTTFAAPNLISGVINVGVIDGGFDGATLGTVSPTPIYQAQIDGNTVDTLLDHPFSLVAGSGGVNSTSASFGPDVSGVPVTSNIGIQLRFTLTPGDTASILSRFDVVEIPGPAAISLLGIAPLCLPKRRRRV